MAGQKKQLETQLFYADEYHEVLLVSKPRKDYSVVLTPREALVRWFGQHRYMDTKPQERDNG